MKIVSMVACALVAACPVAVSAQSAPIAPPPAFDLEGYSRLAVTFQTAGAKGDKSSLNLCPDEKKWDGSLKDLLSRKSEASIGAQVLLPDDQNVDLNPITVSVTTRPFGGPKCAVEILNKTYRSPLFYNQRYGTQAAAIHARAWKRVGLDGDDLEGLDTYLASALKLVNVPAPAAEAVGRGFERAIKTPKVNSTVTIGHQLDFNKPNAADWSDDLSFLKGDQKVTIYAVVEPVYSMFPSITAPAAATTAAANPDPSALLNAGFPSMIKIGGVDTPVPNGNVAGFVAVYAYAAAQTFSTKIDLPAIDAACTILRGQLEGKNFSSRDLTILMWALTQTHPSKGGDPNIDHIPCVSGGGRKAILNANGIALRDLPKPDVPPQPKKTVVVTIEDMQIAAEVGARLAVFFKTASWQERAKASDRLFGPGTRVDDPAKTLFSADKFDVNSASDWLAYIDRDKPIVRSGEGAGKFGCYAYVDPVEHPDAAGSSMMAIAQFGDAAAPQEVALLLTFAAREEGKPAQVTGVRVQHDLGEEQLSHFVERPACADGFQPKMLFGKR